MDEADLEDLDDDEELNDDNEGSTAKDNDKAEEPIEMIEKKEISQSNGVANNS